jgi:hypothetical protein
MVVSQGSKAGVNWRRTVLLSQPFFVITSPISA